MDPHRKKMQTEWVDNTERYQDRIGMTGRRPVPDEFDATVVDLREKFDLQDPLIRSILDVGCNNGYLLKRLSHASSFRVGIDFCYEPLTFAAKENPDIFFMQAEISQLPFQQESFDRVLCYNMYHYLPSPEAGFEAAFEIYRVLKNGGQMLIGDVFTAEHRHLIPDEDKKRWNDLSRPFLHRMENWMFMPIYQLQAALEAIGADVLTIPQSGKIRCPGYRYDLLARKGTICK